MLADRMSMLTMADSPRNNRRISYAHFLAAKSEQELSIDDDLGNAQKELREVKALISIQSKKNFTLEKDVRYLDGRIALLIQNRMNLDEKEAKDMASLVDDGDDLTFRAKVDDKRLRIYSNLFFLLQTEPKYIATLCRLVTLSEIDNLLQSVMFTLYGNQYDSREEYLLLSMFQMVLAHQFETATEFGSLMRANTPVSRMMTTYTRRGPGQTYLKTLLSERIGSLIKHKDLNLEINPLKVYEQILEQTEAPDDGSNTGPFSTPASVMTPDEAAKISEVQQIVVPRIRMLKEVASSFVSTIIGSIDSVPYGIRWICKQIKGLAKRKYPDASDWEICSLIGGFFMLRYVNPAIVTPQAFMLVPSQPSKHPRRTLTLIAKMLQTLANGTTQTKEEYMQPLAEWAQSQKERITQFFWDLCEVPDFYEDLELDQYVALSKRDMTISITVNELYGTQALLWAHRDVVAPVNSNIRVILDELGAAPQQVPRTENRSYQLELYSRWQTDIGGTEGLIQSTNVSPAEVTYLEAKTTFVELLRSCPQLYVRPLNLVRVLDMARSIKDEAVTRSARRAFALLTQLEDANIVSRRDGYRIITEEVQNELVSIDTLKERIHAETASLRVVYKAILEHNDYLRSQLDTYRSYLQNVRMKTTTTAAPSHVNMFKALLMGSGSSSPSTSTSAASTPIAASPASSIHSLSSSPAVSSPMPSSTAGVSTSYSGSQTPIVSSPLSSPQHSAVHLSSSMPAIASANGSPGAMTEAQRKAAKKAKKAMQVVRFTHMVLEKDGVIVTSIVPEQRKFNITLAISSPTPGTFVLSLDYKGRDQPILELDLRLDDLLEKQQDGVQILDLEYVQLSVSRLITLLNKNFVSKSK
ncbi:RasGAP protein [Sorochytrium milnesiophthora]